MFPITGTGALVLALFFGAAFGWLLHQGRVTDYNVIVNQFLLRDFTVAKVMLTAIVVGGVGLFFLVGAGAAKMAVRDANMLATIIGAAVFGVGMAIYGYCPGTGLAAAATGSVHAAVGVLGMLAGGIAYGLAFDGLNANVIGVWKMGKVTLAQVSGLPPLILLFALALATLAVFFMLEGAWARRVREAQ